MLQDNHVPATASIHLTPMVPYLFAYFFGEVANRLLVDSLMPESHHLNEC
jgi:hypothetical protein